MSSSAWEHGRLNRSGTFSDFSVTGKRPQGLTKHRPQTSIRKSASLGGFQHLQKKAGFTNQSAQPRPLPSPSSSNSCNNEGSSGSPVSANALQISQKLGKKRKRSRTAEDPWTQIQQNSSQKRARISLPNGTIEGREEANSTNGENDSPIEYWTKTGSWPKELFRPTTLNMSQQLIPKRSFTAMSYSQGVKKSDYPPTHSPEYEKRILIPAGIIMDQQSGESVISDDSKQLCTILINAVYEPPENSLFEMDLFWKVLNGVRNRNEARVVRDISSQLIPSAELLFMRGLLELEHLTEEMQTMWTKCFSLAGPLPKPDFTVGFRSSAFTDDEIEKLKYYGLPYKPTLFIEDLYFPFLVCEVKCGQEGTNIADRQNARSASTAVNAILQLHSPVSRVELHRKILVFSVSHDHSLVNIYGHYALIKGGKFTFHRHLIRSFTIADSDGQNRWTTYNMVRKIYDHFAPIHLKRIRDAVALLGPVPETFISIAGTEIESESAVSQVIATSAPTSQNRDGFKKPRLPPSVMLQQEIERQARENGELKEQLKQDREESKKEMGELKEQIKQLIFSLNSTRGGNK